METVTVPLGFSIIFDTKKYVVFTTLMNRLGSLPVLWVMLRKLLEKIRSVRVP
jgi:hypothetical protein